MSMSKNTVLREARAKRRKDKAPINPFEQAEFELEDMLTSDEELTINQIYTYMSTYNALRNSQEYSEYRLGIILGAEPKPETGDRTAIGWAVSRALVDIYDDLEAYEKDFGPNGVTARIEDLRERYKFDRLAYRRKSLEAYDNDRDGHWAIMSLLHPDHADYYDGYKTIYDYVEREYKDAVNLLKRYKDDGYEEKRLCDLRADIYAHQEYLESHEDDVRVQIVTYTGMGSIAEEVAKEINLYREGYLRAVNTSEPECQTDEVKNEAWKVVAQTQSKTLDELREKTKQQAKVIQKLEAEVSMLKQERHAVREKALELSHRLDDVVKKFEGLA